MTDRFGFGCAILLLCIAVGCADTKPQPQPQLPPTTAASGLVSDRGLDFYAEALPIRSRTALKLTIGISLSLSNNWNINGVEMLTVTQLNGLKEVRTSRHPLFFHDEFYRAVPPKESQTLEVPLAPDTDHIRLRIGTLRGPELAIR